jgi:hypothetical protein
MILKKFILIFLNIINIIDMDHQNNALLNHRKNQLNNLTNLVKNLE